MICSILRRLLLAVLLISATSATAADDYLGKTFRVIGVWSQGVLRTHRIQLREPEEDAQRGQVLGRITDIEKTARKLHVGPVEVSWADDQAIEQDALAKLAVGDTVRASGRIVGPGALRATSVEPRPTAGWPIRDIQLTGIVTSSRSEAGYLELEIMGLPVHPIARGYNRDESLTLRQDARRPVAPLRFDVFGKPLRITGEYDMTLRERRNHPLDDADDRNIRDDVSHEFKLEFFLPYSEHLYFFAEAKAFYNDEFRRTNGQTSHEGGLARGLSWVYVDGFADNRLGVQVGRQNVHEPREWWWDDDLDAVRAYFDDGPWHAEIGFGREVARTSTRDARLDPAEEDLNRYFGRLSWLWAPRQTLDAFVLHQDDRSARPAIGSAVDSDDQDNDDGNLTWFGLRGLGQRSLDRFGTLRYWGDVAWVAGKETLTQFDDDVVVGHSRNKVRGFGLDAGLSWQTPWPGTPAFTIGFAHGSGDSDPNDGTDSNFRQTGLHNNKWRFFGVHRFRIYGELLRPELSNLDILTLAVGLPFLQNSSAELIYHRYRQSRAAQSLRDVRISAELDGKHRDVGEEIDLVLGIREGGYIDLFVTAGLFKAGSAYGELSGKTAAIFSLEFVFFF
ncbi:MAG TPA: alginate export family protein [Burkholderiales bacterium]|nr:alginate export family protein [Burkholderiales bacterium]